MGESHQVLQFQPLQSAVDSSFWAELTTLKLHRLKLSEEAVDIRGFWGISNFVELPTPLQLDSQSFRPLSLSRKGQVQAKGQLWNFNTLDKFKTADRDKLVKNVAAKIWSDIKTGAAEKHPDLLSPFLLMAHAELKSYKFYYWFSFPALKPPSPFHVQSCQSLEAALEKKQCAELVAATEDRMAQQQSSQTPFWLVEHADTPHFHPLSSWSQLQERDVQVAMLDASNLPANPSWPLRNLLLLAAVKWGVTELTVICWRSRGGRLTADLSLLLRVKLPPIPKDWLADSEFLPAAVGWEANVKQKLGPRMADMGSAMDPVKLAESAADLNVRLMKWRAAPSLDVDSLAATSCLLLGAGTLGCAVARTLLGWGIRTITFVDSSRVSYSNPVRQSLYEFEDCQGGGAPKAAAAAAKLRAIFPSVSATGVEMTIPMPGHALSPSELPEAEASVRQLEEMIREHDVVFLLMDTRESRWLPTLLCAAHNKLAINAALGFDSYLVMRHGHGFEADSPAREEAMPKSRLGCYFCNDVVAPLDSTVDRTLDQQCTVARPGLAPIAGALAVEMMAAVLQHPDGVAAPSGSTPSAGPSNTLEALPLGHPPHMLRGQLGNFSQLSLTGQAFSQCTACSSSVVQQYREQGWPWLQTALQDPRKLEDLTGLTELMKNAAECVLESDDELAGSNDDDFIEL